MIGSCPVLIRASAADLYISSEYLCDIGLSGSRFDGCIRRLEPVCFRYVPNINSISSYSLWKFVLTYQVPSDSSALDVCIRLQLTKERERLRLTLFGASCPRSSLYIPSDLTLSLFLISLIVIYYYLLRSFLPIPKMQTENPLRYPNPQPSPDCLNPLYQFHPRLGGEITGELYVPAAYIAHEANHSDPLTSQGTVYCYVWTEIQTHH